MAVSGLLISAMLIFALIMRENIEEGSFVQLVGIFDSMTTTVDLF